MGSPYPAIIHSAIASYDATSSTVAAAARHYWKLDEPKGSTVVKSATQGPGSDGNVVGAVELGVSGLVANGGKTAARLTGGHISIPDSDILETDLLSVSGWFSPASDLVAIASMMYVKFDETSGTSAANSGYLGTAGTYAGGPTFDMLPAVPGVTTRAVRFSGLGQYVTFPHHVDQRLNGSFTIAWWAAHDAIPAGQPRIFAKGAGGVGAGYEVYHLGSSGATIYFKRNNQEYAFPVPSGTFLNRFHHHAIVYDEPAQTLKWYYDGVLRSTTISVTFPDSTSTNALTLASDGGTNHHIATLDDFLMYASALSDSQVQQAMAGVPVHVPSGQWWGGITRENIWGLGWQSFSHGWTFDIWIGGVRQICELPNSPVLKGERYFVVGDYNGGQMRLLINGVVVATTSIGGNIDDAAVNTPLNIGIFHGGLWKGVIDEVLVHQFPVTNSSAGLAPRMLELYQAGISQDVVAYCPPKPTSVRERILYIRPEGQDERRYLLHAPPSRVVMSEEGFGTPPLEYVTDRAPFQHGANVRSFHANPRVIQLAVMQNFRSREEYWNGRAELTSLLNPGSLTSYTGLPALSPSQQGKLLCYLGNSAKRQIDVVLESGPGFAPPQGGWREWSFTEVLRFIAHDPAWYDPTRKSVGLFGTQQSQITFPVEFPVTFSSGAFGGTLTYLGNWFERPQIALIGPMTSPVIRIEPSGKQITLNYTIPLNEQVLFDLRSSTVETGGGINLLGFLSDDSDLTEFRLEPDPVAPGGVNTITVTATGISAGQSAAAVSYFERYIAI